MSEGGKQMIYIVLWRGADLRDEWGCDGIYTDLAIAQARLNYEKLKHPKWAHVLVVGNPDAEVPATSTEV